jgi:hypothetical protein
VSDRLKVKCFGGIAQSLVQPEPPEPPVSIPLPEESENAKFFVSLTERVALTDKEISLLSTTLSKLTIDRAESDDLDPHVLLTVMEALVNSYMSRKTSLEILNKRFLVRLSNWLSK